MKTSRELVLRPLKNPECFILVSERRVRDLNLERPSLRIANHLLRFASFANKRIEAGDACLETSVIRPNSSAFLVYS